MPRLKGIALENIHDTLGHGPFPTSLTPAMERCLGIIKPEVVRLELRLAGYTQWDATLVEYYATMIDQIKQITSATMIIAEITYQSVPGASQAIWNAGHTEPVVGGGAASTPFAAAFLDTTQAILSTPGVTKGLLKDRVNVWEIWNEPNNWVPSKYQIPGSNPPAYGWHPTGWDSNLGQPAEFDPKNRLPSQQAWLNANPSFPLNPDTPGGFYIYPSVFASVLNAGVSTFTGNGVVICGGILSMNVNAASWPKYLDDLATHFTVPLLGNGMGQHLYLDYLKGVSQTKSNISKSLNLMSQALVDVRAGSDIYITESGWTGSAGDCTNAANACTALMQSTKSNANVKAVCWFTLMDIPGRNLGLFDTNGTPKPQLIDAYNNG
jgi:hypothetical protein